jgi:hypothetical protein
MFAGGALFHSFSPIREQKKWKGKGWGFAVRLLPMIAAQESYSLSSFSISTLLSRRSLLGYLSKLA